MEKVSVIVPTISGREHWLRKCLKGYKRNTRGAELELIVIHNEPSCGHAWAKGAEKATGDFIHFTADDIIPRPGWFRAAHAVTERGALPAANVGDIHDQRLTCDCPLGKYKRHPNVLVPFFTREQWEMGDWVLPCHYGTDDWITYLAVKRGMKIVFKERYNFRHFVAEEGRDTTRRLGDVEILVEAMEREGYVPPVYADLLEGLRSQYSTKLATNADGRQSGTRIITAPQKRRKKRAS